MFCFTCNKKIISNKRILKCKCGRYYCENKNCWNDANDEYIDWDKDGTPRNKLKHLLIDCCDNCILFEL